MSEDKTVDSELRPVTKEEIETYQEKGLCPIGQFDKGPSVCQFIRRLIADRERMRELMAELRGRLEATMSVLARADVVLRKVADDNYAQCVANDCICVAHRAARRDAIAQYRAGVMLEAKKGEGDGQDSGQ